MEWLEACDADGGLCDILSIVTPPRILASRSTEVDLILLSTVIRNRGGGAEAINDPTVNASSGKVPVKQFRLRLLWVHV